MVHVEKHQNNQYHNDLLNYAFAKVTINRLWEHQFPALFLKKFKKFLKFTIKFEYGKIWWIALISIENHSVKRNF